ncbi:MAG: hypothetical protein BMS9Abin07_1830 [Acidimicrobiia bacterium]|nr:MAG: hypothetical protein BMS9Abin07_1830 [Acidimicrobiia bacterium]
MVSGKIRVAVLGGGLGGISAAYRLTSPAAGDRFEVTVYQQGWRIGGKAASGRNLAPGMGERIEEHGLHMFMGWYDQAFSMMRECYAEWNAPPDHPFGTIDKAFIPQRKVTLAENLALPDQPPDWELWTLDFPHLPGEPGDDRDEIHPLEFLRKLLGWLPQPAGELGLELASAPAHDPEATWHGHSLARQMSKAPKPEHPKQLLEALEEAVGAVDGRHGHDLASVSRHLRQAWILLRLGLAIAKGLVTDVLLHGHDGWQRINHLDLKDWLASHGAPTPEVSFSSPIKAFYDLAFAYVDGDTSHYENAQIAAGAALRTMLKTALFYRDAPLWRMTAGMGDVIFGPLYQVLKARGVRFEFFNRVEALHLSPDKRTVSSVDLIEQATVSEPPYEPLHRLGPMEVWPSQPLWRQLDNGDELEKKGVNFESFWDSTSVGSHTIEQGTDYDLIVLGISLGGLPTVAQELIDADAGWGKMVDQIDTVQTQSIQLWTVPDLEGLGWRHGPLVGSSYVDPVDSFADMSQLLPQEGWSGTPPGAVEYLCGPMAQTVGDPYSDPGYPAAAKATVVANAARYLDDSAGAVWPALHGPNGIDYALLYDTADGVGEDRLFRQYFRANIDPSERYVLTPPGTVHLRLDPAESGFDNVYPAGDWVHTSVNGGSAEAAIEAGNLAAAAIIDR